MGKAQYGWSWVPSAGAWGVFKIVLNEWVIQIEFEIEGESGIYVVFRNQEIGFM